MIPKGKTGYLIVSSFLLIAAISVVSVFLFRYFEQKKQKVDEQIFLLSRNNFLAKDIALNLEKLPQTEEQAKEKIKQSARLYRTSAGVFINGGIVPQREDNPLIPPASDEFRRSLTQLKSLLETFRNLSDNINELPYYTYEAVLADTIIDGFTKQITQVEKSRNKQVYTSAEQLKDLLVELEPLTNNIISRLESEKSRLITGQMLSLILSVALVLILLAGLVYLLIQKVVRELQQLYEELTDTKSAFDQDEQPDYSNYYLSIFFKRFAAFKQILASLRAFIQDLYRHNFNAEPSEAIQETALYSDLTALRNDLKQREEQEKERRKREEKRQWAVEGRTKITNILQSTGTISDLADQVIVGLVKFLGAAQGGIFLLRDNDTDAPYLEMVSAFAYDRKKYLTKKIPVGEGLLGMAALEKTTYWLKEIPQEYIEIESGLGESPPRSLFIVPLKAESEMPGVMEIASFKQFEEHEAEFIEDIAQSIGSSLRSVQIAEQTAKLLEESRKKSEELALQDTQMRKRFDELRDAQKKAKKNEMEMSALVSVIDRSLLKCELNLRGFIRSANRRFFSLTDYHSDELKRKDFRMLLTDEGQKIFDESLEKVTKGETVPFNAQIRTKFDTEAWVLLQMAPVRDDEDKISEVLLIGNDITRQKEIEQNNKQLLQDTLEKAEKLSNQDKEMQMNIDVLMKTQEELMKKEFELEALHDAVQTNYLTAEINTDKQFLWVNHLFSEKFGYSESEIKEKRINELLSEDAREDFETAWQSALKKESSRKALKFKDSKNQSLWLLFTLSVVEDQQEEQQKIIMIAIDISKQKMAEKQVTQQAEELKKQEQIMEMNMQEMLEINQELETKVTTLKEKENKVIREQADKNERKYINWIDEIFD
jgi:PAS domain S-box-containing protein